MLTSRKALVILTAVLALVWSASSATAEHISSRTKWWLMPEVAKQLQLTNQEKQQFDQLNYKMRELVIGQRSEISRARLAIDKLMDTDPLDEKAVMAEYDKLAHAQTAIAQGKARFLIEVRKILGRDRFQQLRTIFDRSRHSKR